MNNEPVAWTDGKGNYFDKNSFFPVDDLIPLYTHPVNPKYDPETGEPLIDGYPLFSGLPHPVKELTDEEINELANEYLCYISHEYEVTGIYKFARAILRKAQEK